MCLFVGVRLFVYVMIINQQTISCEDILIVVIPLS